ncbi:hypothetical protein MRX96_022557 [Rhipicephalus microplus]
MRAVIRRRRRPQRWRGRLLPPPASAKAPRDDIAARGGSWRYPIAGRLLLLPSLVPLSHSRAAGKAFLRTRPGGAAEADEATWHGPFRCARRAPGSLCTKLLYW